MTASWSTLTVEQAIDLLDTLASAEDPIEYQGKQLGARQLLELGLHRENARRLAIRFYAGPRWLRFVEGSLAAMVLDRLGYLVRQRPVVHAVAPLHGTRRTKLVAPAASFPDDVEG